MKGRFIIFASVLGASSVTHGQALFSAGKTNPTIMLSQTDAVSNQVLLASQTSAVHLSYDSPSNLGWKLHTVHWGLDLSANATGNTGTLIQNNSIGTAGAFQGSVRFADVLMGTKRDDVSHLMGIDPRRYDEFGITGGVSTESDTLYDESTTSFDSKRFNGWNAAVNYWAAAHVTANGKTEDQIRDHARRQTVLYFGGRWGIAYANNISDLQSKSIVYSSDGLQTTKTADLASQYEDGTIYPGRFDLMVQQAFPINHQPPIPAAGAAPVKSPPILAQAIGLDFYASKNTVDSAEWQPGIALVLFNPGKPFSTLGGLDVTWTNGKSTVGMFVGYSF